ncbi:MAG: metallophosphoesterase [Pseudomonadota bacterium]
MIYWLSYLYFPASLAIFLILRRRTGLFLKALLVVAFLGMSVLAYARFVEPRILLTVAKTIEVDRCVPGGASTRFALIGDTHIGEFANAMPVSRIARSINKIDPDFTLFVGDFTYQIDPDKIVSTFRPLGALKRPVYAVLGNHDVGYPGPLYGQILPDGLTEAGLRMIDNQSLTIELNGVNWELVGLSDEWEGKQDLSLVASTPTVPRILMTHNPETSLKLPSGSFDLMVAGHTHGGQILLTEELTCRLAPVSCGLERVGLKETDAGKVFVTSGTGMVGLPMRLRVPPRIHVINLVLPDCDAG